jgi:ABC-type amino acid transport substrate-binding protein
MSSVLRLISFLGVILCFSLPSYAQSNAITERNQKTITLAYAEKWPPFSYRAPSGEAKGILIEIANFLLRDEMGFKVNHILLPWKRAQAMVKNGRYDALLAVPNSERNKYSLPNQSEVYSMQVRAFIPKNSPHYSKLISKENPLTLSGGHFSLLFGDKTCTDIYEKNDVNFYSNSNIQQIFKMMASGRSDLFLHSKVAALQSIMELNLEGEIMVHPKIFRNVSLFLLMSQHYSEKDELIKQLDETLQKLKNKREYYARINQIERDEIQFSLKYTGL